MSENLYQQQVKQMVDAFGSLITSQAAEAYRIDKDLNKLTDEARARKSQAVERCQRREDFKRFLTDAKWAKEYGQSYKQVIGEMADSLSHEELRMLVPATISEVLQTAAEPGNPLTAAFTKISTEGLTQIEYPVLGAIEEPEDVGRSSEYPTRKISFAGSGFARMAKVGMRLEIEEDVTSQLGGWNVLGMIMTAAGQAMGRKKERRCAQFLLDHGTTLIDNLSSSYLNSSGVSLAGAQNGTLTLGDLVFLMGDLIDAGYNPDTIVINGMAWSIFAMVPELREWIMAGKMQGPLYQTPQGEGGVYPGSKRNPLGAVWTEAPALATTMFSPESSITGRPTSTIISPYMPMSVGSTTVRLTDIIVADGRYLGAILSASPVQTEEWDDPRFDVRSIKMSERYTVAPLAQAKGIRVAKNIALQRGLDPFNVSQFELSGSSLVWPNVKTALTL